MEITKEAYDTLTETIVDNLSTVEGLDEIIDPKDLGSDIAHDVVWELGLTELGLTVENR